MKKSLSVILITIFLDAVGIGLIMPILPELLRSLAGAEAGGGKRCAGQAVRRRGVRAGQYAQ